MTHDEFEKLMQTDKLDIEYCDYIMLHTDARINNGDMLQLAAESGKYLDGFRDWMCDEKVD